MIEEQIVVGLAVERRELGGQWGGTVWRPIAVFPVAPDVEPWTSLGQGQGFERYYAGAIALHLFSTDTANYRDNLATGAPKLWVVMRPDEHSPPVEITIVTADPAEGEASTEAGSNVVETLAMPPEIAGAIAGFIAEHHVERPMIKRKRDSKAPGTGGRSNGEL